MAEALEFEVLGRPVPFKHMTQRTKYLRRAQRALEYQKRVKSVAWAAMLQYGRRRWDPLGPFHLEVWFYLCRKPGRVDATNLFKNVEDGLTPGVMKDDSVMYERQGSFEVVWVETERQERVVVRLTPLEGEPQT